MFRPEEIAGALSAVEESAAHLERLASSQDEEFRRLLNELAANIRLLADVCEAFGELHVEACDPL